MKYITNRHDVVQLETAKLAKELGFKEKTFAVHSIGDEEDHMLLVYGDYDFPHILFEETFNDFNSEKRPRVEYFSAPTQSQLQKWLRVQKGVDIEIISAGAGKYNVFIIIPKIFNDYLYGDGELLTFTSYEHALESALVKVLSTLSN